MNKIYAFPYETGLEHGMELRDYFAIRIPEPSIEYINMQGELDRNRNPHGDSYKPQRRSRDQIVAQYKYKQADSMMEARKLTFDEYGMPRGTT